MEDRRRIIVPYKRLLDNTDKPFSIIRRQYFLDNKGAVGVNLKVRAGNCHSHVLNTRYLGL